MELARHEAAPSESGLHDEFGDLSKPGPRGSYASGRR